MRNFAIISDSSCDLDFEHRSRFDIDYVNMTVIVEGKEYPSSLDWEYFTPQEFYNKMREGQRVKSALINEDTYIRSFKKHLDEGKDILSISCSSALSGSVNSSYMARDTLLKEYPDAKIICIDALRASLALGLMLCEASKQRADGKSIDEVAAWIEENKLNFHQVGSVEDLIYLKRAGRVTGVTALMASFMKIKPIIIANAAGENMSVAKIRGRKSSIWKCIEHVKNTIINPQEQEIFIVQADCYDEMLAVKEMLFEEIKCKDVKIFALGTVIGASTGPGMFGIYYYGQKVTE